MSPRPILKQSARRAPNTPLAVHFPPSPSLTTHTFATHSRTAYDRSPIVVSPNSCALPERGCPGRTYMLDEASTPTPMMPKRGHPYGGRDLHPRAIALNAARQQQEDAGRSLLPPLIPDLSSESDESDGFASPPLEPSYHPQSSYMYGLAIPQDKFTSVDIDMYGPGSFSSSALSFLPHPPSSPTRYNHELSPYDEPLSSKPKRRRERKHDSSRTPDRIPGGSDDVPDSPTQSYSRKSKASALSSSLAARHATSCLRIEDDGCLGGF